MFSLTSFAVLLAKIAKIKEVNRDRRKLSRPEGGVRSFSQIQHFSRRAGKSFNEIATIANPAAVSRKTQAKYKIKEVLLTIVC